MGVTLDSNTLETYMDLNRENIRKLATVVENSETYDQRFIKWGDISLEARAHLLGEAVAGSAHPCGTPACIAGHAIAMQADDDMQDDLDKLVVSWLDLAADWFGFRHKGYAMNLFDAYPLVIDGIEYSPTPEIAAETLRHLADTGEVDWHRAKRIVEERADHGSFAAEIEAETEAAEVEAETEAA